MAKIYPFTKLSLPTTFNLAICQTLTLPNIPPIRYVTTNDCMIAHLYHYVYDNYMYTHTAHLEPVDEEKYMSLHMDSYRGDGSQQHDNGTRNNHGCYICWIKYSV